MKLTNTYEKIREGWYKWTVRVDGTDDELKQVKYVTYYLHETFPQRQIVSKDIKSKFSRSVTGWGEFEVRAKAILKNGKVLVAENWLDLGFENTAEEKAQYSGIFVQEES